MKKTLFTFSLLITLLTNTAFAQPATNGKMSPPRRTATDHFAWGPALTGLAVLGVVVGVVVTAATNTPNTFSH